jgi:hypothetical protein
MVLAPKAFSAEVAGALSAPQINKGGQAARAVRRRKRDKIKNLERDPISQKSDRAPRVNLNPRLLRG